MPSETIRTELLAKYEGVDERVGFILKSGEIVEVDNICEDPENGFEVRGRDILRYLDELVGTWHTHPGVSSNLSANDHLSFRNFPDLKHYIVGNDGVACYEVKNGVVLRAD